jgi:hypothetical protein
MTEVDIELLVKVLQDLNGIAPPDFLHVRLHLP